MFWQYTTKYLRFMTEDKAGNHTSCVAMKVRENLAAVYTNNSMTTTCYSPHESNSYVTRMLPCFILLYEYLLLINQVQLQIPYLKIGTNCKNSK